MITFVSVCEGDLQDILMVGENSKNAITFFDVENSKKLFDLDLNVDDAAIDAINIGDSLYVAFLENTLRKYEVYFAV